MSYQKLFDHMHREHDLILVDSELSDIAVIVREMDKETRKTKITPIKILLRCFAATPIFLLLTITHAVFVIRRVCGFIVYGGGVKINNEIDQLKK